MDRATAVSTLPPYLIGAEVAGLARTTVARVRYWDRKGLLPSIRPPGTRHVLYPRDKVLAWLEGRFSDAANGRSHRNT